MKTMKIRCGLADWGAGVMLALTLAHARAGSVTVQVGSGGLRFVPSTATIAVDDSVVWTWAGNFHSTTSGNAGVSSGLWDSGVHNAPHSFTNTFTSAGSFPYYCSIHYGSGMTGSITVTNPAVAPVVVFTNPVAGAVFSAPATIRLAATASVAGGAVTSVQFLQGTTVLGSVTVPPYALVTGSLSAGNYTFSAIATADSGLTATNTVSASVIQASPLVIFSPARPAGGMFAFSYASDPGLTYLVQKSAGLATGWTSVATNRATANPSFYQDANPSSGNWFYRVARLPNP